MHKFNQLAVLVLAILAATTAWAQQGNARGPIGESPYNIISLGISPLQSAASPSVATPGYSLSHRIVSSSPSAERRFYPILSRMISLDSQVLWA
jgi:hypothetical protein